jgi:hypothetical protein
VPGLERREDRVAVEQTPARDAENSHPNGASLRAIFRAMSPHPTMCTRAPTRDLPQGEPRVRSRIESAISFTRRIDARRRNTAISAVESALPVC